MGDGPSDGLLDASGLEARHALEGPHEPVADDVVVDREQRVLEFPPRLVIPGRLGSDLLVDADEARLLFLADVSREVVVAHDRQLTVKGGDLRHRLGDDIGVKGVGHRHPQADHAGHPVGVAAGGVDHVLAGDGALFGYDVPVAVRASVDLEHPVAARGGGTPVAGPGEHGVGGA